MIEFRLPRILTLVLLAAVGISQAAATEHPSAALERAVAGAHREPGNVARDRYRHPLETLSFFGLQAELRVLEILPGRGWYTEILAPLLRERGSLTVAGFGSDHPNRGLAAIHDGFIRKLEARPDVYDRVRRVIFQKPGYLDELPDAELDMVVTFRNTHNWVRYGGVERIYREFHRVLRPGGILGVVQHRAKRGADPAHAARQGYVAEDYLIGIAEAAGLRLLERSEINANPRDTSEHPKGVWSLPPTLRLKDRDREKYLAIGESDRMTLRFLKPPQ